MTARLTAAEARKLGLDVKGQNRSQPKRKARASYRTRCVTCGEEFTTEADEERHLVSHHHARYELVIQEGQK